MPKDGERVEFAVTTEPFGGRVGTGRVTQVEVGNVAELFVGQMTDELFGALKPKVAFAKREADGRGHVVSDPVVMSAVVVELQIVVTLTQELVRGAVPFGGQ